VNGKATTHRLVRAALVLPVLGAVALGASCASDTVRQGEGGSFLIIEALEGASGADDNPEFSTVMASDVRTNGGIVEDPARVRMRLALKDIGTTTSPTQPTTNNFVTVSRYRVVFRRADGRNQPGVDVPYAFDGGATFTVGSSPITAGFTIVRVQAKLEAPLAALAGHGGALAISTLADVTFFGRDQVGNEVTVSGTISVNFADWADP
jgi:hypothetical protein